MGPHPVRITVAAAILSWLGLVVSGFVALYDYDYEPGPRGEAARRWPEGIGLTRTPDRVSLVMLAHPRCPCTRAGIAELHRLQAQGAEALEMFVVFVRPDASFGETDLWRRAAEIPGARVSWDEDGRLSRRFGAETSGHVVVHDALGRLVLSGGITPSRGHQGDSPGRRAILACLDGEAADEPVSTPVYGCPLSSTEESAAR